MPFSEREQNRSRQLHILLLNTSSSLLNEIKEWIRSNVYDFKLETSTIDEAIWKPGKFACRAIVLDATSFTYDFALIERLQRCFADSPIVVIVSRQTEDWARRSLRYAVHDFIIQDELNSGTFSHSIDCALIRHRSVTALGHRYITAVSVMDHLTCGIILIDRRGHVVLMNRAASNLIHGGDGFFLKGQKLRANIVDENDVLERQIAEAFEGSGSCLSITGGREDSPLFTLITPLADTHQNKSQPAAAVCLFIANTGGQIECLKSIGQKFYRLTESQYRLAGMILQGRSATEAAAEMGVSINTVRSHLQNIFQKTGTCRQTELVRLIFHASLASIELRL